MADEELELDVNEKKGGKKTIILVVVGILLLNGIGVGAWIFLSAGGDDADSHSEAKKENTLGPIKYLTFVPEFIVNFGPNSRVRYLQVDLQIATRDAASLAIVNANRPVLRNDILVLLSDVKYDELKDRAGKEALQKKLLNAINKVVVEASHSSTTDKSNSSKHTSSDGHDDVVQGPIENVYFISFIMQ